MLNQYVIHSSKLQQCSRWRQGGGNLSSDWGFGCWVIAIWSISSMLPGSSFLIWSAGWTVIAFIVAKLEKIKSISLVSRFLCLTLHYESDHDDRMIQGVSKLTLKVICLSQSYSLTKIPTSYYQMKANWWSFDNLKEFWTFKPWNDVKHSRKAEAGLLEQPKMPQNGISYFELGIFYEAQYWSEMVLMANYKANLGQ